MAEINNSIAAQVGGQQLDLTKTLSAISQIDLARAHAGLYGLQAQQEARKLSGLEYLKSSPTDYIGAIQRGLDPSVGSTLQTMSERERQYKTNPQGLSTESTLQLTSAGKNIAETGKIGAETQGINIEQAAKLAQGVIADPSNDSVWRSAVDQHYKVNGGSELEKQQLLGVKDPNVRLQIAKAYGAQGVSPNTFGAPHAVGPTQGVKTPGSFYEVPLPAPGGAPVSSNRPGGALPSTSRVMGDDEGVRSGLYEATPEQRARGVTVPASPNQQVAGRFGAMQPAYSLRGAHAEETAGANDAKYSQAVVGNATNARQSNYTLDAIRRDSAALPLGRGMAQVAEGRAWLQSVYDNVPGMKEVMKDPGKDATAAYDSLLKNSGQLTRQALVQTGERAAMAYDMIQKQLPNIETSRGGLERVVAEWQGLNDDALAKQQVMARTPMAGRSDAFESEWNSNVNPVAFMLQRMTPADRKHVVDGLRKSKDGQRVLEDLQGTVSYLSSKGIR